jgi:hypothetical protein
MRDPWGGFKVALVVIVGLLIVVGVAVGGRELEWWLKADNTDRQTEIDRDRAGTQTALREEARRTVADAETLPEEHPARGALEAQACGLIEDLTDRFMEPDLQTYYQQECAP